MQTDKLSLEMHLWKVQGFPSTIDPLGYLGFLRSVSGFQLYSEMKQMKLTFKKSFDVKEPVSGMIILSVGRSDSEVVD